MSFDAKPLQIKSLFTKHIFTIPRNQRRCKRPKTDLVI